MMQRRLAAQGPMRPRPGFSLTELLLVIALMGVGTAVMLPTVSRSLNSVRADRVAGLVAADLKLAFSMASRTHRPVRVTVIAAERRYTITDRTTGDLLKGRRFDSTAADLMVTSLTATAAALDVFPNGVGRQMVDYMVTVGEHRRLVRLTRTGHVRVTTI